MNFFILLSCTVLVFVFGFISRLGCDTPMEKRVRTILRRITIYHQQLFVPLSMSFHLHSLMTREYALPVRWILQSKVSLGNNILAAVIISELYFNSIS